MASFSAQSAFENLVDVLSYDLDLVLGTVPDKDIFILGPTTIIVVTEPDRPINPAVPTFSVRELHRPCDLWMYEEVFTTSSYVDIKNWIAGFISGGRHAVES